jgi:Holliday junction DNA helicase RuvA
LVHVAFFYEKLGANIMIGYLKGTILFIESNSIVLDTNGVGYQVFISKTDLSNYNIGQTCELFIHTNVKEDAIDLYGFAKFEQKEFFLLLTSVSGVGNKIALTILSSMNLNNLCQAILQKDISLLSSIPGIGKKTAERLSLELKDKVLKINNNNFETTKDQNKISNLSNAIINLGFSRDQSQKVLKSIGQKDLEELDLEILLRKSINVLTGNKNV